MNWIENPPKAARGVERRSPQFRDNFSGQRMVILPREVTVRCRRLPVIQDLYVTDLGHFPSAHFHYRQRSTAIAESILIYCTDGGGWCRMGGRRWHVRQGDALLVPAGVPHTYAANRKAPWSIYWVHFSGLRAARYLAALGTSPAHAVLHSPDYARVVQGFEELFRYVGRGYTDADLIGLSTELARLLGLLKVCRRAAHSKGRHAEDRILESLRFLRSNVSRRLTLAEMAHQACLSPSHYLALFRKHANASPLVFFTRLKMQAACALLDAGDAPVKQIAQQVGFHDQLYFSRCFRKVMGMAPSAYREASRKR